jgi:hypothetical protein
MVDRVAREQIEAPSEIVALTGPRDLQRLRLCWPLERGGNDREE